MFNIDQLLRSLEQDLGGLLSLNPSLFEGPLDVSNDAVPPPSAPDAQVAPPSGLSPSGLSVTDVDQIPVLPEFKDTDPKDLRIFRTILPDGRAVSFRAPPGFDIDSLNIGGAPFTPEGVEPLLNIPGGTLLSDVDPQLTNFIPRNPSISNQNRQIPYSEGFLPGGSTPQGPGPNVGASTGSYQALAESMAAIPSGGFDPSQNFGRRQLFSAAPGRGLTFGTPQMEAAARPKPQPQASPQLTESQLLQNLYNAMFPGGVF